MTANDLFDNDLQLKQLFDNINAPKSQRNTKKEINSIVVDPFKVSSLLETVPGTFKQKRRNNTSSCINDVFSALFTILTIRMYRFGQFQQRQWTRRSCQLDSRNNWHRCTPTRIRK